MTTQAKGTFEVTITPQATLDTAPGATLSRLSLSKQFRGDLNGSSAGEMLAARTEIADSAGYVAIERVTGTLHGRTGSFVLQHSGIVTRGEQSLTIHVVPDSGTGELKGISGQLAIIIVAGAHSYEFTYALP
jgi:predicted flavoprotein YhiN